VIKINKVFLGEGDANVMAKVADSVNYPEGELEVTLTRYVNDNQVNATPDNGGQRTITFRDSLSTSLVPGAFSTTQRLYVNSNKLYTSGQYKLTVHNRHTGNDFVSRANSLDSINGNQGFRPMTTVPSYPYPPSTSPGEYIDYANYNGVVRFVPDKVAKIYQVKIRTHFYDSSGVGKKYDYVDYDFGTRDEKTATTSGNLSFIVTDFRIADYWNAIGIGLSKKNLSDNIYGRKAYMIEYFVYSSTQEYLDFLQYTSPSFAITQNTGIYSNFDKEAAIGIFTFRTRCSIKKEPANFMINEFSRNPNTCNYRFYDSQLHILGCQ
jgi:hypothetical protein